MRRKLLFPAILFVCVFGASCVVLAPASLLGWLLERASNGALLLANTSGTIWNGTGVMVLRNDTRFISLGEYAWHVQPSQLFAGNLSYAVRQGENARPMMASIAPLRREVRLIDWRAVLPAQMLESISAQLRPYRFGGEVEVESPALLLSNRGVEGRVTMNWTQASSGMSDVYPLGNYLIALDGHGAVLDVELSTQSGKLQLSGKGRLEQGKGLSFNGEAKVSAGVQDEGLNELLHHLGPETSPGIFALVLIPQAGG